MTTPPLRAVPKPKRKKKVGVQQWNSTLRAVARKRSDAPPTSSKSLSSLPLSGVGTRKGNGKVKAGGAALKRRKGVAKSNPRRRKSEFARCYHSKGRVAWVKARGCPIYGTPCGGEIQNAHTVTGGKGRKAGYETIIPLCAEHHRAYDEHRAPFDDQALRDVARHVMAPAIEREWQAYREGR